MLFFRTLLQLNLSVFNELPSSEFDNQQLYLYISKFPQSNNIPMWVVFLGGHNTYITPAVYALHLPHQWYPGMPVVTVLVIVLAKFAVPRAVCLHHVAVLQACGGPVLLWTLFTAVRGITSHRMTAGQHWTCHLLTVYLPCRSLWRKCGSRLAAILLFFLHTKRSRLIAFFPPNK